MNNFERKMRMYDIYRFVVTMGLVFWLSLFLLADKSQFDFNRFTLPDIEGDPFDVKALVGSSCLYIFFEPALTDHKLRLAYAQVLFSRYGEQGLRVVGIAHKDRIRARDIRVKAGISFPLIWDENSTLRKSLKMTEGSGGVVLFDKAGNQVFMAPYLPNAETLRQLVEKEITGQISYETPRIKPPAEFLTKDHILSMRLFHFRSGKSFELRELTSPHVITFFSAFCSACKSGNRLRMLQVLDAEIRESGLQVEFGLVFLDPLDDLDIMEWARFLPMHFQIYLGPNIFPHEIKYITQDEARPDPFSVIIDKKESTIHFEPVPAKDNEIKSWLFKTILMRRQPT